MKVHLIDGTFELFRAFYSRAPSREDDSSKAVRGLARSLLALLTQADVTHVAIAFDHVIESFRNTLFAGYKRGDDIDPVLRAQFEPAEDLSRALGIVTWPMVDFEADDALATGARRFAAATEVEQVVLCSPDKDLTQCVVGQRVVCLDRVRDRMLDEAAVKAKFGIPPPSVPDWLALVGDSADGIPGVPRWGAKSASTVLARYERLEAIPARAADWDVEVRGAQALAATLEAAREDALLYRQLARLRRDAPIIESLHDLRWRGADSVMLSRWPERDGERWLARARSIEAAKA